MRMGGWFAKSRARLLAGAPVRPRPRDADGASDVAQSRRELQRLEERRCVREDAQDHAATRVRLFILRSTPGPGTQAGGAASHIKGVSKDSKSLGVEVQIISNDLIAGLKLPDDRFTVIPPQPGGGTRALFDIHNNLVFTRGAVPLIERADPDFIYQRTRGLVGPAWWRRCARSARCFSSTTVRKFGWAALGSRGQSRSAGAIRAIEP
jgi:hypothetical protein